MAENKELQKRNEQEEVREMEEGEQEQAQGEQEDVEKVEEEAGIKWEGSEGGRGPCNFPMKASVKLCRYSLLYRTYI